ncbi:MAG: dihydrolipoamide acetyltransferase family protein [Proteobacteria bacterium]|nr:dihydrolipoamide acetyltransferase family protein [Pseudomonadota bacterium]
MSDYQFNLPDIGEGLGEGEIVRWLVEPGSPVRADQIMVEVETDKAVVEIPAPVTGTLKTIGGGAGDVIAVGKLLAVIETDSPVAAPPAPKHGATKPAPAAPAAPAPAAIATPAEAAARPAPVGRVLAAPATRKRAVELGVDLARIRGSGPQGRITREDVEQAASGAAAASAPPADAAGAAARIAPRAVQVAPPDRHDEVVQLRGLRKTIAESMTASLQVPAITDWYQADATELVAARTILKEEFAEQGVRLTYLPFFIKACVLALQKVPSMNATFDMAKGEIVYRKRFNIGVATATEAGLIVPVLHDADMKSIFDLAIEITELAELTRSRKIPRERLMDGTFTITNFGSYGARMGTPIIRPPEAAIAGFGAIRDEVIPVDGQPAVRPVLPVCASTDHRLNDGEHLWTFVKTVTQLLEKPARLLGYL